jgi:hypothetical protein
MFWYEKYGDSRTIHVELNSHEIGLWQQGDGEKIKETERYALINGLRRQREQYAIGGFGDLVLSEGTIKALQEKYPDVSEKSRG